MGMASCGVDVERRGGCDSLLSSTGRGRSELWMALRFSPILTNGPVCCRPLLAAALLLMARSAAHFKPLNYYYFR